MSYETKISDHKLVIATMLINKVDNTIQSQEFQDNIENLTYQLRNRCFSFVEFKAKAQKLAANIGRKSEEAKHKRIKGCINEIEHLENNSPLKNNEKWLVRYKEAMSEIVEKSRIQVKKRFHPI